MDAWMGRRQGEAYTYDIYLFVSEPGAFQAHLRQLDVCRTEKCVFCYEVDTAVHRRRCRWMRAELGKPVDWKFVPDTVIQMLSECDQVDRCCGSYVTKDESEELRSVSRDFVPLNFSFSLLKYCSLIERI